MQLLYANEHLSCFHYDKMENPTIRYIECEQVEERKFKLDKNIMFIMLEGSGFVSFGKTVNKSIEEGDIILLPAHTESVGVANEKIIALLFYLPASFSFCDHFSLEMLHTELKNRKTEKKNMSNVKSLKINQRIKSYLDTFLPVFDDGLKCQYYLDLKIKELFFLLRAYNTKEDLATFFAPILTDDMDFYNQIMSKYLSVKTVKELAQLTNYSLTGFEKRFKKIFGTSAHKWIKSQLATNIYHEIRCSRKTFMEISDIYGFSSSAHFSNFCKSTFGKTPKSIRKGELKDDN